MGRFVFWADVVALVYAQIFGTGVDTIWVFFRHFYRASCPLF